MHSRELVLPCSAATHRLLHAGIIMDGNGRWAVARNLPRTAGHRAGAAAVRRVIEAAPDAGIGTLTLFAFSSDNWARPRSEVQSLMRLFRFYLRGETARCMRNGVKLSVIGRRHRLTPGLVACIEAAEATTAAGETLHVRLAVDYSARDSILEAAGRLDRHSPASREEFAACLAKAAHADPSTPDLDLIVRTGGEQRLSDFLLWESAYAELVFVRTMWPDFGKDDLAAVISEFHRRERRFGNVPARRDIS